MTTLTTPRLGWDNYAVWKQGWFRNAPSSNVIMFMHRIDPLAVSWLHLLTENP
jgi:hypothetical protein